MNTSYSMINHTLSLHVEVEAIPMGVALDLFDALARRLFPIETLLQHEEVFTALYAEARTAIADARRK